MKTKEGIALSDEEILKMFRRNSREGFRLIYEKYADRLFTVCRRYSANDQEAMDNLHDSMLKVIDRLRSFHLEGEGSLFKWITRLSINLMLDKRKTIRRQDKISTFYSELDHVEYSEPDADQVDVLSVEEVEEQVKSLSPVRRTVFSLFYFEGYSHKEIAHLLGIIENGSSSTLSKAKKDLAELLCHYLKQEMK